MKKHGYIFLLILFLVYPALSSGQDTQTVYTWTDDDGNLHITDRKPPENATIQDELNYKPTTTAPPQKKSPATSPETSANVMGMEQSNLKKKADAARRKANEAAKTAEKAIEEALKIQKETDEFVKNTQIKARRNAALRVQINERVKASNEAIDKANNLRSLALEAEEQALTAEEAYRKLLHEPKPNNHR